MIENAEIYNDYFSDYSDVCKYSSSAGEFICFNFFIKSYVFPPQKEDGGVPPPEITLHRIASVSMMEQQANELYSILGMILQKRESD
ncbi:TPA: hypothetical protein JLU44_005112 [Escherichia coli]|uniref:hypothetical protein n=1 Tax=Escherichia coli TaxID=562 RepID=UPI00092D88D2|nr:hypothetical protein [Escherichia coli]APK95679.1 hypothetical protein RG54_19640 [Escherichia coli]APL01478.1 hypothetical protein RG55_04840 [Escherichia coli]HAV8122021.1 hypothetical protein [Escherichia coli]HAV8149877.1 hypothetical protein [Escherichia coli]HAV9669426.1 hypothetical protein [Escherichia coli]